MMAVSLQKWIAFFSCSFALTSLAQTQDSLDTKEIPNKTQNSPAIKDSSNKTQEILDYVHATVQIDWNAVPSALKYEFEFKDKNGIITKLSSDNTSLIRTFNCGRYTVRARTLNKSKIEGPWGPEKDFDVPLKQVQKFSPEDNTQIQAEDLVKSPIEFKWSSLGEDITYKLEILNEKKELVKSLETPLTQVKIDLEVGKAYIWRVLPLKPGCSPPTTSSDFHFDHLGRLKSPIISQDNYLIRWTKPDFAETYDYVIERKKTFLNLGIGDNGWETVYNETNQATNEFLIGRQMSLGIYRIKVTANGHLRKPSDTSAFTFDYSRPRDLETRFDIMGGYMLLYRTISMGSQGFASAYDGYILNNYKLMASGFFKGWGLVLDWEQGSKKLFFQNQVSHTVNSFFLKTQSFSISPAYEYVYGDYGILLKLVYANDVWNSFSIDTVELVTGVQKATTIGIELGPKLTFQTFQVYPFYSYHSLLKSSPYRLTPYTKYGVGIFIEKFMSDAVSAGGFAEYTYLGYNYEDVTQNNFTNTLVFDKFGFYMRWSLH